MNIDVRPGVDWEGGLKTQGKAAEQLILLGRVIPYSIIEAPLEYTAMM